MSHRVVFFPSHYLVSRLIVLYLVFCLILNGVKLMSNEVKPCLFSCFSIRYCSHLCSLYVDDLAIYYSSSHMPFIERKLQHSLNRLGRWCDENDFKFSPTKTMCVHFCQLRKHHLDPQLYLNGTQIPTIGEAKFLGLIFDSKLSFIPHITSLKSRCTKSLDLIKVVSNTTLGS